MLKSLKYIQIALVATGVLSSCGHLQDGKEVRMGVVKVADWVRAGVQFLLYTVVWSGGPMYRWIPQFTRSVTKYLLYIKNVLSTFFERGRFFCGLRMIELWGLLQPRQDVTVLRGTPSWLRRIPANLPSSAGFCRSHHPPRRWWLGRAGSLSFTGHLTDPLETEE